MLDTQRQVLYEDALIEAVVMGFDEASGLNHSLDAIKALPEPLKPKHFTQQKNAVFWDIFQELERNNEPINLISVHHYLQEHSDTPLQDLRKIKNFTSFGAVEAVCNVLEDFGLRDKLSDLLGNSEPVTHQPRLYGLAILKAYYLRQESIAVERLREAKEGIIEDSDSKDKAYGELHQIREALSQLTGKTQLSKSLKNSGECIAEFFDYLEQKESGLIDEFMPTGFADIDKLIDGLAMGMSVVFARSGMGKTAFALNIAVNRIRKGDDVLIFSLEMTRTQLMSRIISSVSGVNSRAIRKNQLTEAQKHQVFEAMGEIADYKLSIYEGESKLETIKEQIQKYAAANGAPPRLVIVDYLQKISVEGNRYEAVTKISQELSNYATFFKVKESDLHCSPFRLLAVAQASRAVEQRQDKRPVISDLKESGQIEQDAQLIMGLYRESYYSKNSGSPNEAELIICKNRHGETGMIDLLWDGATTTFKNLYGYQPM